jgi:cytochrome b6-f complex iron-sulfur subunit/menaquinol-cytochrome c reductase iron-sulfur subunit
MLDQSMQGLPLIEESAMSAHPPESPEGPSCPEDPRRRKLVTRLVLGLGAILTGALAAGPIGVLLHPLLGQRRGDAQGWNRVGLAERFRAGDPPTRVVLKADLVDAWRTRRDEPLGAVMVERLDAATFRVLSARCPHLGCSVQFQGPRAEFVCPCHQSVFQRDGERVEKAGGETNPAPRGLDPLVWRVAEGVLEVQWVRYQTGTAQRNPIT